MLSEKPPTGRDGAARQSTFPLEIKRTQSDRTSLEETGDEGDAKGQDCEDDDRPGGNENNGGAVASSDGDRKTAHKDDREPPLRKAEPGSGDG